MLTHAEAARIAASGSALRPDWSQEQIIGVLRDPRIRVHRTPADTAAALARLALDPDTRQPTRLLEAGPWWTTAPGGGPAALVHRPAHDDCSVCHKPKHPDTPDHPYVQMNANGRGVHAPAELIDQVKRRPHLDAQEKP